MWRDGSSATTVGIIGGHGQFGRWVADLCQRNSLPVIVSDRGTTISNVEVVRSSNVVFVTVPIGVTVEVIEEIAPALSSEQVLVDLTSVKAVLAPHLMKLPCEVLSLHPMFSPSLTNYNGQTCVSCRLKSGELSRMVESLLTALGISIVEMTVDEHDRTMAIVQGLTHFQAFTAAHCMVQRGVEPRETLAVSSPVYRLRMMMVGRILAQDPKLYAEIQIHNPYVRDVLQTLQQSTELFMNAIERRDVDGFAEECRKIREALGSFTEDAFRESNRLIEVMAKEGPVRV